jgi:hypothetical protein
VTSFLAPVNKVLSTILTPRDLLRVPNWNINLMVMDMNQVTKEKIMVTNLHKESNLLTEKKGLGVLGFDIMVLPLSMDNVILEHVCLQTKINQNVSYIAQHNFLLEIEGAFSDKGNHFR